jgi:hypothetical protein
MSQQESTPLLANAGESNSYYFLNNDNKQGGGREKNGGAVVEEIPHGSHADEFEPRILGTNGKVRKVLFFRTTCTGKS